jgi:penicillin-binding protein 2
VWTQPTILHQPNRPRQRTEKSGLTPEQRAALLRGMEQVTTTGTARILQNGRVLPPLFGLRVGAKTGTAQSRTEKGMINFAWLIAFAPIENPQIAIAVAIEGDTPGEETGGGLYASPVAHAILRTWMEQRRPRATHSITLRTE